MTIPLPEGTTRKDVDVTFFRDRLKVTIAGLSQPALEGDLPGDVDMDGCYWEKEDDEVFLYMVRFVFFSCFEHCRRVFVVVSRRVRRVGFCFAVYSLVYSFIYLLRST